MKYGGAAFPGSRIPGYIRQCRRGCGGAEVLGEDGPLVRRRGDPGDGRITNVVNSVCGGSCETCTRGWR